MGWCALGHAEPHSESADHAALDAAGLGMAVLVGVVFWPISYVVLSYALLPVLWLVLRCVGRAPGRSAKGKPRRAGDAGGGGAR